MTIRSAAPLGAPCWVDLWTSDIEASRIFYIELFGWRAEEPSPDFHGYFMFTRKGVPIAGVMGDMDEARANNAWKPFFATENIERTLELASAFGGKVHLPAISVDDLGIQAVVADPAGAVTGIWQAGSFVGFTTLHEHGTPSFVAIDVHDYHQEVAFYRQVFGWDPLEEEVEGHHYAGYM
ncbi:MAG: VOC family protein, partial [Ferrimicrobium sp.]